jgi:multiple sugar transport system permease protein
MSFRSNRFGLAHILARAVYYLLAAGLALLFLLPLIWLIPSSLRQQDLPPDAGLQLIPNPVVWSNYLQAFQVFPLGRQLLNSLFVVVLAVPLTVITASWAGYAIAQLPNPLRRQLVVFTVVLMIVPFPVLWLPRFVLFSYAGLIDTLWPLIIPALMGSSPFFVLLFYWTFRRIPGELFDSARLDGSTEFLNWWTVALPLARPTISVVAVLAFALYWGDFINPLIYLRSEELYTYSLQLKILSIQTPNQPLAQVAVVVAIVPVLLLFIFVQRYFWPEGRLEGFAGR